MKFLRTIFRPWLAQEAPAPRRSDRDVLLDLITSDRDYYRDQCAKLVQHLEECYAQLADVAVSRSGSDLGKLLEMRRRAENPVEAAKADAIAGLLKEGQPPSVISMLEGMA